MHSTKNIVGQKFSHQIQPKLINLHSSVPSTWKSRKEHQDTTIIHHFVNIAPWKEEAFAIARIHKLAQQNPTLFQQKLWLARQP